ncbi:protein sec13 [Anaeramoeba ignava]|uniref:Protein sec13 n=1 Tax=Anaeramoeba ignava TaxID=1746090 RepID=A0A9Q0R898_ANAIG|nr:protein sec13 [Anaeramoeba ignava]
MQTQTFNPNHEENIQDAKIDFYGKKLATCSLDGTIKIFTITEDTQTLVATIKGHQGPVWALSWSHPKFGVFLASCGNDQKVVIWKEKNAQNNIWEKAYEFQENKLSVNTVSFGPEEYGLVLGAGASDGTITVHRLSTESGRWGVKKFKAHEMGVNAISWGPYEPVNADDIGGESKAKPRLKMVSGGCDNLVKIWSLSDEEEWENEVVLQGHKNWIRSVDWSPALYSPEGLIASGSQDKSIIIWAPDNDNRWKKIFQNSFNDTVWSVSWSFNASLLAVSLGNGDSSLWKQNNHGQWSQISDLDKNEEKEKDEEKEKEKDEKK